MPPGPVAVALRHGEWSLVHGASVATLSEAPGQECPALPGGQGEGLWAPLSSGHCALCRLAEGHFVVFGPRDSGGALDSGLMASVHGEKVT